MISNHYVDSKSFLSLYCRTGFLDDALYYCKKDIIYLDLVYLSRTSNGLVKNDQNNATFT